MSPVYGLSVIPISLAVLTFSLPTFPARVPQTIYADLRVETLRRVERYHCTAEDYVQMFDGRRKRRRSLSLRARYPNYHVSRLFDSDAVRDHQSCQR